VFLRSEDVVGAETSPLKEEGKDEVAEWTAMVFGALKTKPVVNLLAQCAGQKKIWTNSSSD
jgi:hypothetical protein